MAETHLLRETFYLVLKTESYSEEISLERRWYPKERKLLFMFSFVVVLFFFCFFVVVYKMWVEGTIWGREKMGSVISSLSPPCQTDSIVFIMLIIIFQVLQRS